MSKELYVFQSIRAAWLTRPPPPQLRMRLVLVGFLHTPPRTIDLPFKLAGGELLFLEHRLCHFWSYDVVEWRTLLCKSVPSTTPLRKAPFAIWDCSIRQSRMFFKLDHPVDISLYTTEATAQSYSRELATLWHHLRTPKYIKHLKSTSSGTPGL